MMMKHASFTYRRIIIIFFLVLFAGAVSIMILGNHKEDSLPSMPARYNYVADSSDILNSRVGIKLPDTAVIEHCVFDQNLISFQCRVLIKESDIDSINQMLGDKFGEEQEDISFYDHINFNLLPYWNLQKENIRHAYMSYAIVTNDSGETASLDIYAFISKDNHLYISY